MSKSNRKSAVHDAYSHPLVRDVYATVDEGSMSVVPSYVPVKADSVDRISSKIVRSAELMGREDQIEMFVSVSMFGRAVETLPVVEQTSECHNCRTKMNCLTFVENHSEMKCNLCSRTTHINLTNYEQLISLHGYRIKPQTDAVYKQQKARRILFMIEASQYNYEARVHSSIFSCLKAMQHEQIEIGFVFYDDRYAMFVRPATMEVTKVALIENESFEDWTHMPLQEDELFVAISEGLGELQQLVDAIMYQSFLIKQTIVEETIKMLHKFMSESIQIECFATTFNSSKTTKSQQIPTVFREKQNIMQQQLIKKLPFLVQLPKVKQSLPCYNPYNLNYFVVAANTNYKQVVTVCRYNLVRVYNFKEKAMIENQLYYDLYQHLSEQKYRNVEVVVRTSKNVEVKCSEDRISTLYGNITLTAQCCNSKMNKYSFMISQADDQFTLPLHFTSKQSNLSQQQTFIQFEYYNSSKNQSIVLNYRPKIDLSQNWLQMVDDELVFNHHLRNSLAVWNEQSYKDLKQNLIKKYCQIVRWFIDQNGNSIVFPKNWKHYLLYSHLFQQKINEGLINQYQLFKLLNKNAESFSKYFYYRVYKIEDDVVKNIKFTRSVFEKHEILFVENGEVLFMVMRDPPMQLIKDIFGYYDTTSALGNAHLELPDLQSNQIYRNAVQTIRNLHETNFLPLRIIDYQGCAFSSLIESRLYEKEKHLSFLRRVWREA